MAETEEMKELKERYRLLEQRIARIERIIREKFGVDVEKYPLEIDGNQRGTPTVPGDHLH